MTSVGRSLARITAVGIVALACAAPGTRVAQAQPAPCPGASCDVVVTVTGDAAAPVVAVSVPELRMGRGRRDVVIVWKLDAPDYEFRADSISAHAAPPAGGKLTTTSEAWRDQCTTLNHTGSEYRIRNRNTKAGPLFYNVKVYRKATGAPVVLDPAIINDP